MNIGSKQTLWSKASSSLKWYDCWDYDKAIEFRQKLAQSLDNMDITPQLVQLDTFNSNCSTIHILVVDDDILGFVHKKTGDTSNVHYSLLNTRTMQWTYDVLLIDCSSFGGYGSANFAFTRNIDGKCILLVRNSGQGHIFVFEPNGTNLQHIGYANMRTSFSPRLYANYDGNCIFFDEDATNGNSWILSRTFAISAGPTMASTFPYQYIKIPGYVCVGGSTGVMSLFDESMSTKLINNRSVGSYICMLNSMFVPPEKNKIYFGLWTQTAKHIFGVDCLTKENIVCSNIPQSDGDPVLLPNGKYFCNANTTYQLSIYDIVNNQTYSLPMNSDIQTAFSGINSNLQFGILPNGKIYGLFSKSNGTKNICILDLGFNKNQCPAGLCVSPFGYNGSKCKSI